MLSLTCEMLKKGHNELLCRTDTDSQTLKNLWFPNETGWGVGGCTEGLRWTSFQMVIDIKLIHPNASKFFSF